MPRPPYARRSKQIIPAAGHTPSAHCIALIADMVKSRGVSSAERPLVQEQFQALVVDLNRRFARTLLSRFVITLGDEFQGLLASASPIPDLLWHLEEQFSERELRVGIGFGVLYTPFHKYALNVDGPALHSARTAIETAKRKKLLGGVFNGFGQLDDVLNGLARILWFHRSRLTHQQRKILDLLHQGLSQTEIAKQLRVSPQNISKHVRSAGWSPYSEAEKSWRIILQSYVDPMIGVRGNDPHEN
jgi:hypothetical protein